MSNTLPEIPDLTHLRKQAKRLLKEYRTGSETAVERFKLYLPVLRERIAPEFQPKLHDAQSVLARSYGFKSWSHLKSHVDSVRLQRLLASDAGAAFVQRHLEGDLVAARAAMQDNPGLGVSSVAAAAVTGNLAALQSLLGELDVNTIFPPREWPPLLYVCQSALLRERSRSPDFEACASFLLQRGADPNVGHHSYFSEDWPDVFESALYCAAGKANCPGVVRLLLEAGASVDDGESLYHSTEHRDLECLRLILAKKPKFLGTNALARMTDFEDLEGLKAMLDAGADPNETSAAGNPLHWTISKGRSIEIIRLLVDRGASLTVKDQSGRTPYEIAVRFGNKQARELFESLGVVQKVRTEDELLLALTTGDDASARDLVNTHQGILKRLTEEDLASLPMASSMGNLVGVRSMLRAGIPVDTLGVRDSQFGGNGATALHWAAWFGRDAIVEEILKHGPDLEILDQVHNATALGWTGHGELYAKDPDGAYHNPGANYARVRELLIAAGAKPHPT